MSRVYTAQEMREEANKVTRYDCYGASDMLRQAADAMEREKKCQYQYAARYFYKSGVVATDHIFDNPRDAKFFSGSRDGAKKIICRREVGEWEEVKDGER